MDKFLNKLIMYHEIHKLNREGKSISYIAKHLVINWRTVKKYLSMSGEEYERWIQIQSTRKKELDDYQYFVKEKLGQHPETSAAQMHDWLKEHYECFPDVHPKTVYNFVMGVRQVYNIPKEPPHQRDYFIAEELPYGKQAQVDFGEYNIRTSTGQRTKVYFFTMVLSRSRYKFVSFSDCPFTGELVVKAHEKAFEFFNGIPNEIVYDQDSIFIVNENKGDYLLTQTFNTYVRNRSINTYFCRKADPETKGKIENVVKYVKQNFLYNRSYYNLDTLNSEALAWLNRTANKLIHGTTKLSPIEQWAIEKEHLLSFSPIALNISTEKLYTVRKDNTISYKSNFYSVPQGTWKSKNTKVNLRDENGIIVISDIDGNELCQHKKSYAKGKVIVNNNHKRNTSQKINQLIETEAKNFSDYEKALKYFNELRNRKKRHIRDQLTTINQVFQQHGKDVANQSLDFCLENSIYSATDFVSVALKFYQEQSNESKPKYNTPEILHKHHLGDLDLENIQISKIINYEHLMKN
jgi:hypothetical protein